MKDGFIHSKSQSQAMVFPENHPSRSLRGEPKGAQKFLRECGLWTENDKRSDGLHFRLECPKPGGREGCQVEGNKKLANGCCARGVLAKEPDFQAQRGRLVEELEALN
jgi:hypothetical protein